MKRTICILLIFASILTLFGCSSISFTYKDADKYTSGEAELLGVESINVSWTSGEVRLLPHEGDSVKLYEEYERELSSDEQLHYYLNEGKLNIKFERSGIIDFSEMKKTLYILIPVGADIENIEIGGVSTSVTVGDVSAEAIEVETVSGDVNIDLTLPKRAISVELASGDIDLSLGTVGELSIEGTSSDIKVEAEKIHDASIDLTNGSVDYTTKVVSGDLDVDTVSAHVVIHLTEGADFRVEFDTLSGDFESECELIKKGDKYYSGSGEARCSVDTTSGNLTIKKRT